MGHACHMHAHTHSNIHFFSLSYLWLPLSANPFYHCIQHLLTEEKTHSRVPLRSLSVQFSCSVVSDSLRPHESQHARPPCPSPTPRVYSNSCPLSRWCHPAISSSVVPFSSCPNPSQHQGLFQWVSSSHEVAKVLEFQLQHQSFQWTPRTDVLLDGLVGSLCSPRDSQESSPTPQFKSINFSGLSFLHSPTLTSMHDYWKTIALTRWTFVGKVTSLFFNMLSRLVITFLPRSKHLLISWLQSPSTVILEPKKIKSVHCFPIYLPWSDGTRCHDLSFLNVEL